MSSASPLDLLDTQALSNVNSKGFVPDEVRDAFFRKIRTKSENRTCFDCQQRNPSWISTSHGIFLCLECSGNHRRMGVHISYVRSCELDSFFPDQIVQMACGGNAKACRYYKDKGMGKTSELGKMVDYHSKPAATYKAQLEKEAQDVCAKLGLKRRGGETGGSVQGPAAAAASDKGSAVVSPAWSAVPTQSSMGTAAAAPKPAVAPKPAAMSTPLTTVVRKSVAHDFDFGAIESAPASQGYPSPKAAAAPAKVTVAPQVAFSNSKQMSKEIDFDFDFDALEAEASAPAPPKPAPVPVSVAPTPPPVSKAKPAPVASPEEKASVSKFSSRKAISSEDFFPSDDAVASKGQLKQFSGASNISSDSLFGEGSATPSSGGAKNGDDVNFDDWMESALQGISKGTDYISSYLNKGFE